MMCLSQISTELAFCNQVVEYLHYRCWSEPVYNTEWYFSEKQKRLHFSHNVKRIYAI